MLAVAMGLADLSATAIVSVMAIAWVLVALIEWIASRESRAAHHAGSAWPSPPPSPSPPAWGPGNEQATAFIAPAADDDADTPAEPIVLPQAADDAAPKRRFRRARR